MAGGVRGQPFGEAFARVVALLGLSGPKASAAVVAQLSGVALEKGVVAGSGMFSVAGILAGAMGVSVVMGGVRMMEAEEVAVMPIAESEREVKGSGEVWRSTLKRRKMADPMTEAEVLERLRELDEEPRNVMNLVARDFLVESISPERVFAFLDRCEGSFSMAMEEQVFRDLVVRAVEVAPWETMNEVMKRNWFWEIRPGFKSRFPIGKGGLTSWRNKDGQGAADWLVENWDEIKKQGREHGSTTVFYSADEDYLNEFAVGYWREFGDEGVERFAENFSEEKRVMMWKRVLKSESPQNGEIFSEETVKRMRRFSDAGIYGKMKENVWKDWAQLASGNLGEGLSWREQLEEYGRRLPPEFAGEFRKACLDEVEKMEGGENE